jgi:hypothetical protein
MQEFQTARLQGSEQNKWLEVVYNVSDSSARRTAPSRPLKDYGLAEGDLQLFGFDAATELGRGVVALAGRRGTEGQALVSLTDSYAAEFEFQDVRPPYLIVKGRLVEKQAVSQAAKAAAPSPGAGADQQMLMMGMMRDGGAPPGGSAPSGPAKTRTDDSAGKALMENTLYLEKDKPSVLGLTNLRQALILVVRLHDVP